MSGRERQGADRDLSNAHETQTLAVWEPRNPIERERWHATRLRMVAGVISQARDVADAHDLIEALGLTDWLREFFSREQEGQIARWIETRTGQKAS